MTKLKEVGIDTLELDVTEAESVQRVKAQVEKMTGGMLDVLVNNAYAFSVVMNSPCPEVLG